MNFLALSALINVITSSVLGLLVFSRKKTTVNISFVILCFSVAIWSLGYFFWQISNSAESSVFWLKFLTIFSIFIPVTFFNFSAVFLKLYKKVVYRILAYIGSGAALAVIVMTSTDYLVKGVEPKLSFDFWPIAGDWYWSMLAIFFAYFALSFYVFAKEYFKATGIYREQIKYILIGTSLGFLGGATNFPLWYNIPIYPIGNILVSLYVFFLGYAIIRYRLLNIKLVLRKSSVYILSLGVVFAFTSITKIVANSYLQEFVFWVDLMALFFAVATFPYIKDQFSIWANRYFFTSLYDSGKLILKTGNELKTFLNIEKVYEFLNETFSENLHTKSFGVLTYDEEIKIYELRYNQGFKAKKGEHFDSNKVIEKKFISKNKIVIIEELKSLYYDDDSKEVIDLLEHLEVELLIPLKVKGNLIGLLALGKKETNEAYNDEDLQVLEIIAGQSAVAIENAQLYSEAKKFNIKLKREVRKATKEVAVANTDLTKTNKKLSVAYGRLKQLDSAKNEFISIASHQLRTPLTSIKGFISLIREGDYGKINKEVDTALKKIFISNERLIKLVNDLLSLSRIESGKFTFTFEKNDVISMVNGIIENFSLEAEDRNLKLVFIKPRTKIKTFSFDRDKMHEVISNLVDNAIKYTPEGKIAVKVEDSKEKIRITVQDSGKGMEKEESKYVFEKFRRGVGSSSLNTEGTGLGLYVCKKIVDAHKGKIIAESDGPGKGSRFIVELKKNLKVSE